MKHGKRIRNVLIAGTGVAGMLALSACAADTSQAGGSGGAHDVTLTQASWVGSEANVAVAKKLLEDKLDVKVHVKQLDEPVAWDALNSGQADAILEDWNGVPKKQHLYVDKKKTVVKAGDGNLGVTGHIGWFVPKYYADKHPDILDWHNLNKHWKDFQTSESGNKGQFIGAAPSYTSHDKALIKNLHLNFKVLPTGSEAAQLKEMQRLYKAKKPFIGYWWQPQWMNAQIKMSEVKLPPYKDGCLKPASKATCGYQTLDLHKYLNAKFAKNGGDAAKFLENFKWTTKDQNKVAQMIAGKHMSDDQAAAEWIKNNKSVWEKWLPKK
jgi:glycine betaine/proline transport system substrate-binding protein